MSKSFEELYQDVLAFNDIAGNLNNVNLDSIDNQLSFIFEELSETITGFEEGDAKEVIDGAADLFVTVSGLIQKLEAAGVDMRAVISKVNENNLEKFPKTGAVNLDVLQKNNPDFVVSHNPKYDVYVLKDAKGKIRKPSTFIAVDLTEEAKSFKLFEEVKNV